MTRVEYKVATGYATNVAAAFLLLGFVQLRSFILFDTLVTFYLEHILIGLLRRKHNPAATRSSEISVGSSNPRRKDTGVATRFLGCFERFWEKAVVDMEHAVVSISELNPHVPCWDGKAREGKVVSGE